MAIKVERVDVWATEIQDRVGGLAEVLQPLTASGANLECILARRQPEKPATALVFLAPIRGERIEAAAKKGGFQIAQTVPSLRIEGADRPGIGRDIAASLAEAGVSVRGLSAMAQAGKFVGYVGFHSAEDLKKAEKALRSVT